jgi:hypothetical protein
VGKAEKKATEKITCISGRARMMTTQQQQHSDNASSASEATATRRKSSTILAALTLNCNLPTIPIINEPTSIDIKKKSLRFDINTLTTEYDTEEIKETKRRITDEIKR